MKSTYKCSISLLTVVVCLIMGSGQAFASHPAEGLPIAEYPTEAHLGTHPQEWSVDDLTFSGQLAEIDSLSWEEQYMVVGLDFESFRQGVDPTPWAMLVMGAARQINELHGYIPDQLTPDELRRIGTYANTSDEELAIYRSPLTGDWPYLQQADHSPGDMYFRQLETHEITYFAALSPRLQRLWIAGYDMGMEEKHEVPVNICGEIYYARVYGWDQTIHEGFRYTITRR